MRLYRHSSGIYVKTASVSMPITHELFEVRIGSKLEVVRLCGIQAVREGFPGYVELREEIIRWIFRSRVLLSFHGYDENHHRLVLMKLITESTPLGSRPVNEWILDRGWGVYVSLCSRGKCEYLQAHETAARENERGLWNEYQLR